jgi:heterodisulfide reductase subunit A-like polyferredoxin
MASHIQNGSQVPAGGAVVQAGWKPYDAGKLEHLGYGRFTNVITNIQMEMAKKGKIVKPSDSQGQVSSSPIVWVRMKTICPVVPQSAAWFP